MCTLPPWKLTLIIYAVMYLWVPGDWITFSATIYNPVSKKCLLCLKEKYFIMYTRGNSSLNKRSEVYNTCRHRTQSLLSKVKWRGYLFYLIINFLFQFSFWYRNRNNISSDVRKFVIPEDCNYVVLVIWNKLVESQVYCNKVISKVCNLFCIWYSEPSFVFQNQNKNIIAKD